MAKYTYDFKHQVEKEREQNLAKQFTLHSAEGCKEVISLEVTIFTKTSISILDVWKGSEYVVA